jgi:Protein of unknown function (DUF2726)
VSIYVLLIVMLLIVIAIKSLRRGSAQSEKVKAPYRYEKKSYFMSESEHEVFTILQQGYGEHYYIFPQVHISKILDHKVKGQYWEAAFKHINGKSVDYLICDKQSVRPLVAIELDGASHLSPDRIGRDGVVETMFKEANMPLVRLARKDSYNQEEVIAIIGKELGIPN